MATSAPVLRRGRPSFIITGAMIGPVLRMAETEEPVSIPGNIRMNMTARSSRTRFR